MKIKVEPKHPVDLDKKRRTSTKGGVYDISKLSEADQNRLLKIKGVSEVKASTKPDKKKEG